MSEGKYVAVIPPGKYVAVIIASQRQTTKSGKGAFLELTFEIVKGEFRGRNVWGRLDLDNPSALAFKVPRDSVEVELHLGEDDSSDL
jgi:hypothetical protein